MEIFSVIVIRFFISRSEYNPSIQNILYFVSCVAFHIGTSLQAAYKHLASLQSTDTRIREGKSKEVEIVIITNHNTFYQI